MKYSESWVLLLLVLVDAGVYLVRCSLITEIYKMTTRPTKSLLKN